MTEEQRKLLTEKVLGECWHEPYTPDMPGSVCTCNMKETYSRWHINRTFDNWQDFGALKEALERKGLWEGINGFGQFAHDKWAANFDEIHRSYDGWLIDKDRFPKLVAEFMEVKNE